MIIWEHIKWALSSLVNNKLRSWLSMLGIIIWVFSIIVMLALWEWTTVSVVDRFNSMWANLITISAWWSSNVRSSWASSDTIDDDFLDFVSKINWVKSVSPTSTTNKQLIYKTYNTSVSVVWVKPVYQKLKNLTVTNWTFITDENIEKSEKVVVIWYTTATDTFWIEDPIWKEIKLENWIYTVIWTLADNSQTNNRVFIPISTLMWKILGTHYYSSVDVEITDTNKMDEMKTLIDNELITYLKVTDTDNKPYKFSSLSEILSSIQSVTWTMTTFLAWIAAISLIVWWIWVMNIMLVSVTERTKEIWIRKALWAFRSDILTQFLIEAMFISILAWAIWIWLSFIAVTIMNNFTKAVITTNSILLSFISVVAIWIIFWILPASKASKLRPIDALRYE